ncbi:MAG: Hsp20/alpha crystallin family protein [Ignavibacteriae bacterium]|nr:MAG: Hsp20/alpha crystallin family protein [Ignavibacteriota bacterium]
MFVRFDYPKTYGSCVNDFFATDRMPVSAQYPELDVIEQGNDFIVTAELPGVKKDDVKITFENNVLTISGSRKAKEVPEGAQQLLSELQSGDFSRSIKFRQDVNTASMAAEMNDGILTITLPKAESVKAKVININ